ncbi:MAG: dihydrolipoyl dehydrogenase [Gammaproteobacteria bacterium]|nr:dihydrolipoyl dehydrogenase [Gammaproteobacteria bacterium]
MESTTQLVVLGAGPGGYTAAFRAADLGLRVTLVEREPSLGGVCLNVGCIPSKALLHAAKVIADARDMAAHGIDFGQPVIDLAALRGWKEKVIGQLTGGLKNLAKQRKIDVVTGEGRFVDAHTLSITGADGKPTHLHFEQAIVAAGSQPVRLPGLPYDDPRIIDSTGALALTDIPPRLLVVGGGIIGLEMATVYAELGSSVTVVELADGLIPGADRDLVKPLEKRLKTRLAGIHLQTKLSRVTPEKEALLVSFERANGPADARFDRVLVAVGRQPNGALLNADKAGIAIDARGYIRVDRQMRTSQPHIFAIGDIVGNPMLAHKATHEGKVAAEAAAGHNVAFDARVIPSVAYTDPEIAWVGLTETEAAARGIAIEKAVFPWAASGRALSLGRPEGLTKLLFDPTDKRIVGAGIVGPAAGDLIAEAGLAIEMSCDAEDLGLTIHPHPTLSETLGLAAEMFSGTITDLYVPRKKG